MAQSHLITLSTSQQRACQEIMRPPNCGSAGSLPWPSPAELDEKLAKFNEDQTGGPKAPPPKRWMPFMDGRWAHSTNFSILCHRFGFWMSC